MARFKRRGGYRSDHGPEADLDFVTEISGSDLQSCALANKRNSEGFLRELKAHF